MESQKKQLFDDALMETSCLNVIASSTEAECTSDSKDCTFGGPQAEESTCGEGQTAGGQSQMSSLLELFKQIHKKRIADIERDETVDLSEKQESKLKLLQSYVQLLEEQNDILISTLTELEKEAEHRVKQMEKRLKSSAKTTMEAVINIHECGKEMRRVVEEKLNMESLFTNMQQHFSHVKVENSFLRDQNFNLNHDVQALLHVIHHARSTGHWEMNCVTFCEVTPEQVFGPVQSISHVYSSESSQSGFQLAESEQKINSNGSSQEVSHSSLSSPSINNTLGTQLEDSEFNAHYLHDELMEKDKKIALLESRLSELTHQLTVKEAECERHVWKLDTLIHKSHNASVPPAILPVNDTVLQKCISVPDIGNIYSYANGMRKSYSCRGATNIVQRERTCSRFPRRSTAYNTKSNHIASEKSEFQLSKSLNEKSKTISGVRRALSEPHLFMFDDNLYVYRPCESIKKASNVALNDDYQMSLPPCQSIDLKFPTDDSNLKVCDWDFVQKKVADVPNKSFQKVNESSSTCSSSDSETIDHSKDMLNNFDNSTNTYQSVCICCVDTDCINCTHKRTVYPVPEPNKKYKLNIENCSKLVSSCIQTEGKMLNTVGLQTDIGVDCMKDQNNDNGLCGMDLFQVRRTIHVLKDSAMKAEDKAQAKGMLIEQLQGHLAVAVKEVELKDTALSNVEKKLETSRSECVSLKKEIFHLNTDIYRYSKELAELHKQNDSLRLKIAQQDQTIKNLQENLVQCKHAFDDRYTIKGTPNRLPSTKTYASLNVQSSKGSIVDI